MARVTVEDCLEQIPNPFLLIQVAAKRARQLARGADARVSWSDHKSTVVALQEIAAGHISEAVLQEAELPPLRKEAPEFMPLDDHGH
ncbi:DNA-directed RNA polymerase subunit omega [Solimonas fluminis]|uniref:DNA-directed RNA polymerase subunit omega n=1 Tax=Solimonas fluminis TaxID=2086571 RepID=A0A2S5TAE4_9GAMM|nr:DNA-directed RNA polymerase subunit omega [Solimonas fluminis]PPE71980.1 DNA-directed RNA polymerase subunit omega [Solimonas fluminis]